MSGSPESRVNELQPGLDYLKASPDRKAGNVFQKDSPVQLAEKRPGTVPRAARKRGPGPGIKGWLFQGRFYCSPSLLLQDLEEAGIITFHTKAPHSQRRVAQPASPEKA
jgi:hypothetical protein